MLQILYIYTNICGSYRAGARGGQPSWKPNCLSYIPYYYSCSEVYINAFLPAFGWWVYLVEAFIFSSNYLKIGYLDHFRAWYTTTATFVSVCMRKCVCKSKVLLFDVWLIYEF